jgi:hypothetical protein
MSLLEGRRPHSWNGNQRARSRRCGATFDFPDPVLEKVHYPNATELLITADGGGSKGRVRPWKIALQRFANASGLSLLVCHFLPGTRKWKKIEHRMLSFIRMRWRGKPLISHKVLINLNDR